MVCRRYYQPRLSLCKQIFIDTCRKIIVHLTFYRVSHAKSQYRKINERRVRQIESSIIITIANNFPLGASRRALVTYWCFLLTCTLSSKRIARKKRKERRKEKKDASLHWKCCVRMEGRCATRIHPRPLSFVIRFSSFLFLHSVQRNVTSCNKKWSGTQVTTRYRALAECRRC